MDNQYNDDLIADALGTDQATSPKTKTPKKKPSSRNASKAKATEAGSAGKHTGKIIRPKANASAKPKTKKAQLIALLSKPNGTKLTVLVERLEWQSHTVRAALSGLRKRGFVISASKSAKGGETVYAIASAPTSDEAGKAISASS